LAGASLDGWTRTQLSDLGSWPHGSLTPVYIDLRRFVTSSSFPQGNEERPTANHLVDYLKNLAPDRETCEYGGELRRLLEAGTAVLILARLRLRPTRCICINRLV